MRLVKYTDNTTLISLIFITTVQLSQLQLSTTELHQACDKWEIKINTDKSKV